MTLKYRESVQRFYRWVIVLTLLAELIIIRVNLFKIMQESWAMATLTLLLASTVPLSILIRLLFVIRPAIKSEYELHSDGVSIKSGRRQKEFKFSNVTKVNYSWLSPRFFGGFNLELQSGQKFRFFSVLENSHSILEKLHDVRADVLVESEYQSYLKTSQRVGESWARLVRKLSNWKMLAIKYLVLPFGIAWFLNGDGQFTIILGVTALVCGLLAAVLNHFEEVHLLGRQKDLAYEAKLDLAVDMLYSFLVVFSATQWSSFFGPL